MIFELKEESFSYSYPFELPVEKYGKGSVFTDILLSWRSLSYLP